LTDIERAELLGWRESLRERPSRPTSTLST